MSIHRIDIEPTTIRGERGQYYRVRYDGGVLIEETWNPEFEACRALVARGVKGRLEVWRPSAANPGMMIIGLIFPDIEKGARWTVVENDKEGPVIRRWEPMPEHLQRKGRFEGSFPQGDSASGRNSSGQGNGTPRETAAVAESAAVPTR